MTLERQSVAVTPCALAASRSGPIAMQSSSRLSVPEPSTSSRAKAAAGSQFGGRLSPEATRGQELALGDLMVDVRIIGAEEAMDLIHGHTLNRLGAVVGGRRLQGWRRLFSEVGRRKASVAVMRSSAAMMSLSATLGKRRCRFCTFVVVSASEGGGALLAPSAPGTQPGSPPYALLGAGSVVINALA